MTVGDPTNLQAVATAANLSLATVSKILGGKYKGNTPKGRERVGRVQEIAKRMGYVANATARRLRRGSHHAVVVIAPVDNFGQPSVFTPEFIFGINNALREQERGMILYAYPRIGGAEAAQRLPKERFYDGALVIDSLGGVDRLLARAGVPAAFINVDPGPGKLTFLRDERAAGADLTRALAGLGYRRILVVGENGINTSSHTSYGQRWAGIQEVAKECELEVEALSDAWWTGSIWKKFPAARIDPGTAVLAMDVHTVLAIVRMMRPGTPLACCDDCHLFYDSYRELTRVAHDRMALGRMAADMLLAHIANPIAAFSVAPVRGAVFIGTTTPTYAV